MSDPNFHPLIIHKSVTTTTMAREYCKGNWTLQETLTLITAKKLDDERRLKTTARNSGGSSGELRWKWVENYCWSHGCLRSQNQCNDKWDNLLRDYKKVREYEAKVSNNNNKEFPSYWTIEKHRRKELKLPSNMLLQVYQAVTQVLQRKSSHVIINPPQPARLPIASSSHDSLPVVATQPPPLSFPPLPSLPPPPPPSQAVSEGSESSGTEYNDKDDNSESKRRKFEKLGSSIRHSASELARALGSCEEKKEKRHQEMMQLQQLRLQMEETRNQMNQQEYTNLVSAVTNLTGVIQSLITSMTKDNGDACSS